VANRGRNEGTIYKRRDGRWEAAVSLGGGRRRRFYGSTRREAADKLRRAQTSLAQGMPLVGERLTLGQCLARWLEESARPTLRPRVYNSYRQIVSGHLTPALGHVQLAKLTPDAVQVYMNRKLASGLRPNTVRNHHAVLRRALTQAERWGLVPRNVARLVTPPRAPREEVRPLTPEQARIYIRAIEGNRLEALFQLALCLGMRQGELLGLSWRSLDLEQRTLRIERSLQRYDSAYHLDEVKTDRSRRVVGLPEVLVNVLRTHRSRQLAERMRAGPAWRGTDWELVFTSESGEPLDGQTVRRTFKRTLKAVGLPPQRFHDLRHAAASFMLAQGVPLRVAQEVLGHSTITVTADLYSHLAEAQTRDATERVGSLLWG
jgi:integrase